MNLQLSTEQQQMLVNLYRSFNIHTDKVTIQMSLSSIKIQRNNSETTLVIPENKSKRKSMDSCIEETYNADCETELTVITEENLDQLLEYAIDPSLSNGQRILAYSKIWEKGNKKIKLKETSPEQFQNYVWRKIKRNGPRFLRIADRSFQLMEVVGGYLPRKFELITPTWLQNLKLDEFNSFIDRSKARYRQSIELLAGA
jgi:hypothetical protein